ncbi:MAG: rod-binding protein [Xanthomonadaceae bacterium]|nr:rod-binding protein [Xanthomonadaceae bacterium]
MSISAANHADIYTDFQGLAKLRAEARSDSPKALREAARQFEALFLQQMLKSMREASMGEGLMDNDQTKHYQSMYDQQLGIDLSKGRGLGLAETLMRQLGRSDASRDQSGPDQIAARAAPTFEHMRTRNTARGAHRPGGPGDGLGTRHAAPRGRQPES